jgi:hypothetical protein
MEQYPFLPTVSPQEVTSSAVAQLKLMINQAMMRAEPLSDEKIMDIIDLWGKMYL